MLVAGMTKAADAEATFSQCCMQTEGPGKQHVGLQAPAWVTYALCEVLPSSLGLYSALLAYRFDLRCIWPSA